jgi:signal transduction histidine kinase
MNVLIIFGLQAAAYAAPPFYLAVLRRPIRAASFYIYLGIVLALGGFLGSVYSFPITKTIIISGGSLAYGALMMTTILMVILENDVDVVRNVVRLVITVNIFVFLLFNSLAWTLSTAAIINPFNTSFQVFEVSLKYMLLGEVLIIGELLLLLVVFEWFKTRVRNMLMLSIIFAMLYIVVLCLDGVLFPTLAFGTDPALVQIIYGGLPGKFVMAVIYSFAILVFLMIFRKKLKRYVREPLRLRELPAAPRGKLLDEIERQRESLETKTRQLQELSQHQVEINEAERRYIAKELHDDLGQQLTGLKLMLEIASRQGDAERPATIEKALYIIADLSGRIRNLSLDLRPAMLDDFGLFAALEWLFGRYTEQTKITVKHDLSFMDERRFPRAIEVAAFRVVQESLTNIARYAQIDEAEVRITASDKQLHIEVIDCGKGFDTSWTNYAPYRSGGLSGMRERVSWLGGVFDIRSAPGGGTTVSASFDLDGGADGQD